MLHLRRLHHHAVLAFTIALLSISLTPRAAAQRSLLRKTPASGTPAPAAPATPAVPPREAGGAEPPPVPSPSTTAASTPDEAVRGERIKSAYRRATALANAGDLAAAKDVVKDFGETQGTADPYYDELLGTVLAIAKDYAAAQAAFERLLAKVPTSHVGRFNRAEMILLQSHYEAAEKEFLKVEEQTSTVDPAVADLCRFKRIMCLIGAGKLGPAELLVPPLQESFESPALCYARATLEYAKRNTTKAVQLLEDAHSRFSEAVENLYTDSLVELRWGQRDENGRFFFKPHLR